MSKIYKIDVDYILPNPFQPRKEFSKDKMRELAHSIKVNGLLQPITVRISKQKEGYFEVIAGERRLRATKALGIEQIECIIQNYDDNSTLRLTTIENLQRDDLNAIEEARAYLELKKAYNITQEQVSNLVSKSRAKIANSMRLLDLPQEVQDMILKDEISGSLGRTLLGLKDKDLMII
ncbi:ParB/RepB/Spo0J family partition protein [Candidatus Woesearchaeota archaeon]|nr:ParB/RepB/Spo0J family partition protein [Candidatus Woesearchaeota archaeon]